LAFEKAGENKYFRLFSKKHFFFISGGITELTKKFLSPLICQVVLFLLQYIAIPFVFVGISSTDTARQLFIKISTTAAISFVGMFFLEHRFRYWLLCYVPYIILTIIIRPYVANGSDTRLFTGLDNLQTLSWSVVVLLTEFAVWVVVVGIKKLLKQI
jgi:hypothetical protein